MKKELFVGAIESLEKQYRLEEDNAEHLGVVFPHAYEANLIPKNYLYDVVIGLIGDGVNGNLINYFCWEMNFGKDGHSVIIDGELVDCGNASELYDLVYG